MPILKKIQILGRFIIPVYYGNIYNKLPMSKPKIKNPDFNDKTGK